MSRATATEPSAGDAAVPLAAGGARSERSEQFQARLSAEVARLTASTAARSGAKNQPHEAAEGAAGVRPAVVACGVADEASGSPPALTVLGASDASGAGATVAGGAPQTHPAANSMGGSLTELHSSRLMGKTETRQMKAVRPVVSVGAMEAATAPKLRDFGGEGVSRQEQIKRHAEKVKEWAQQNLTRRAIQNDTKVSAGPCSVFICARAITARTEKKKGGRRKKKSSLTSSRSLRR